MNTAGLFFDKLFKNLGNVADLPREETSPEIAKMVSVGVACQDLFTAAVDWLRTPKPCLPRPVVDLAALLWNLVGHKVTPCGCMDGIDSMGFYFEQMGGRKMGIIFCPMNWPEMVAQDTIMQAGAVVFNGSKARDFYNDRAATVAEVNERAAAYEAEFLHGIRRNFPLWKPNDYQQFILTKFPEGLASLRPSLWYESKPWEPPQK